MTVDHRQLGVDLFKEVWRLMETREDDDRMLHAAYASRFHWGEAPECTPANLARGEWQVSRVYTVLGRELPETQAYKRLASEVPIAEAGDREQLEKDLATL